MKKEYEKPIIEIVEIDVEDIITKSGTGTLNMHDILNEESEDWFNLP